MTPMGLAAFSALGGLLGLDTVSFPQVMVSRPIVAATLGGAACGSAASGVVAGATLELFALETLPMGASRYPEWGSASAIGGALYTLNVGQPGALLTSVAAALIWAYLGGLSMVQLRKLNAHWARARQPEVASGSRRAVVGLQWLGLAADFVRAVLLTAVGLALWMPVQRLILGTFSNNQALPRIVVVASASAVALGAVWKAFHATPWIRWLFAAGLVAGIALAVLR